MSEKQHPMMNLIIFLGCVTLVGLAVTLLGFLIAGAVALFGPSVCAP